MGCTFVYETDPCGQETLVYMEGALEYLQEDEALAFMYVSRLRSAGILIVLKARSKFPRIVRIVCSAH